MIKYKSLLVFALILNNSSLIYSCANSNLSNNIKVSNNFYAEKKQSGKYIFDYSKITGIKTGVNLATKINLPNKFSIKDTKDGVLAKTQKDVRSIRVYLLKSTFPPSGSLDSINITNSGIIIDNPNADLAYGGGMSFTFENLPPSAPDNYYIAGILYSSAGGSVPEIGKTSSYSITNPTLSNTVQVSTTSAKVNADYSVSSNTPLTLSFNLLDGIAPQIDTKISLKAPTDNDTAFTSVRSYNVYLTSNQNIPFGALYANLINLTKYDETNASFLTDHTYTINRGYIWGITDNISIQNFSPFNLPLYAVVQAYSGFNNHGVNLIKPNNGGASYGGVDINRRVAVSTNNASVDSNTQLLTFTPNTSRVFQIDIKLETNVGYNLMGSLISSTNASRQDATNIDALDAFPQNVVGIAIGKKSGDLYYSDIFINAGVGGTVIKKIKNFDGKLYHVAGNTTTGYDNDLPPITASSARLNSPSNLYLDNNEANLYIADTNNNKIRKIDLTIGTPTITTVAGSGISGFAGDGFSATTAKLNFPTDITLDSSSNLYIADTMNNRIRIVSGGSINTYAGDGTTNNYQVSDDGNLATTVPLVQPQGLYFNKNEGTAGYLYISCGGSHNLIRKIDLSTQKIYRVAGTGTAGNPVSGNLANTQKLNNPTGIKFDQKGDIYILNTSNSSVYRIDHTDNNIYYYTGGISTPPLFPKTNTIGSVITNNSLVPTASVQLQTPSNNGYLDFDQFNNLYITDTFSGADPGRIIKIIR